jgi:hypothetical protein
MLTFSYNDMEFTVQPGGGGWDIARRLPGNTCAPVAAGLFKGLDEAQAQPLAQALVRTVFPVGVRLVGPDVNHPITVGGLKIVGPDVGHPNFVYWNKDSVSCT